MKSLNKFLICIFVSMTSSYASDNDYIAKVKKLNISDDSFIERVLKLNSDVDQYIEFQMLSCSKEVEKEGVDDDGEPIIVKYRPTRKEIKNCKRKLVEYKIVFLKEAHQKRVEFLKLSHKTQLEQLDSFQNRKLRTLETALKKL